MKQCMKTLELKRGGQELCIAGTVGNTEYCWEHQSSDSTVSHDELAKAAWDEAGITI